MGPTFLKTTEATCQTHYEHFFTLTSIELNAKGANPDAKYYGLCANGWLNFIQLILLVQAFLWVATLLVSSLAFLQIDVGAKVDLSPVAALVGMGDTTAKDLPAEKQNRKHCQSSARSAGGRHGCACTAGIGSGR